MARKRLSWLILGGLLGLLGLSACYGATTTSRLGMVIPAFGDPNWDVQLRNNFNILDASMCIQGATNNFTGSNTFSSLIVKSGGITFLTPSSNGSAQIFNNAATNRSEIDLSAPDGVGINTVNDFTSANLRGVVDLAVKGGSLAHGISGRFAILGSSADASTAFSGFTTTNTIAQSVLWALPSKDGLNGQCLSTDGSANLSWVNVGSGGSGASALAVNQNAVQITSPTVAINALAPPFKLTSVGGGTTTQWNLDATSVTLAGPILTQTNLWSGFNNIGGSTTFAGNLNISSGVLILNNPGSAGQILTSGGSNAVPSWSAVTVFGSSATMSSLIVNQTSTQAVTAINITSTGTGNALSITENGEAGGAVQQDNGGALNVTQKTLGDAVVIVSSYSDAQIGTSDLLILDRNVNRNDPIIRVFKAADNSAPEMRWDSPAPNMEMVATATDTSHGRGKWEPFAIPYGSEIMQAGSNRCWDNSSFENMVYLEPLNIQSSVGTPGIYLKNSDSTGCDSAVVSSSNTSGINFFSLNAHTVGLTGPRTVTSGSWRVRLSSTIPVQGEVIYVNGADANGDYPMSYTQGGGTGQCLQFNSGAAPTWGSCGGGGAIQTVSSMTITSQLTLAPIPSQSVLFADTAGNINSNTNFLWDNGNQVFVIGGGASDAFSWLTMNTNQNGAAPFTGIHMLGNPSVSGIEESTNTTTNLNVLLAENSQSEVNHTLGSGYTGAQINSIPVGGPDNNFVPFTLKAQDNASSVHSVTIVLKSTGVSISSSTNVQAFSDNSGFSIQPTQPPIHNASYTALSTDTVILASAPANGMTITLPAVSASTGQILVITKVDQTTNSITIVGNGTDVMQGTGTLKLNAYMQTDEIHAIGLVNNIGMWMPWGQGIQATPNFVGPGFQGNSNNTFNASSVTVCGSFTTQVPVAVDSITVHVGTGLGGTMDVGIYDTAGNRIASASTTTLTSSLGRFNIPLTSVANLPPGIYWMCIVDNNTTTAFHSTTAATTLEGQIWQACAQNPLNMPLPATLPFPCGNTARLVQYNMWGHVVGGNP